MRVWLRYGREGLEVELPRDNVEVLYAREVKTLTDPSAEVRKALKNPLGCPALGQLCRGKRTTCVLVSDITRPVPNKEILPPVLEELEASGIERENITILIGTGLHRPNEGEELVEMFGEEIVDNYNIVNHDSRDEKSLTYLGDTPAGTPVYVNTLYLKSELKIAVGLIEPHLMAGFSGGRKAICPGICSPATMRVMHGPEMLDSPFATSGVLDNNPFHREASTIARMAGIDFLLNVTINGARRAAGIFAGGPEEAFLRGVEFNRQCVTVEVDEPVDVVVTTSAGYPLDTTYYQSAKGMVGALPILKEEGTIVIAAACEEGLGGPEFTRLLFETPDLATFEEKLWGDDFFVIDQWQLQEVCKARHKAEIYLFSDKLEGSMREHLLIPWVSSVEEGVAQALENHGSNAKIAVIPEGPYVLPVVKSA